MAVTQIWIERINRVTEEFKTICTGLDIINLNERMDTNNWSVAQILDHLILTNTSYFPIFQELKSGSYQPSFMSKIGWLSSFIGSYILKSVQPRHSKKIKTFPIWTPKDGHYDAEIINCFISHQESLKMQIAGLEPYIESTTIHSPANRHIVYPLNTALDIIATHEERHLEQAKSVLLSNKISK